MAVDMDAFVSHSSANRTIATEVESGLQARGLRIWLDEADIHLGSLLRQELQTSIRRCHVLLLLWSKPASASRWINAEWLIAFHLGKFILPCTLDEEPLPQCLESTVFLNIKELQQSDIERLARAIKEAPSSPNRIGSVMRSQESALTQAIDAIRDGQQTLTDHLGRRDVAKASEVQSLLDDVMEHATNQWPFDPMIVNLSGYHLKNAYMVKHWAAIQAGRGPRDELLGQAERRFFESLWIDPTDPSALNGLGSILMLERELDASEFFIRAAIAAAKKRGMASYEPAEQDLETVLYYKNQHIGEPEP
jgi:TIR domain-containing protein